MHFLFENSEHNSTENLLISSFSLHSRADGIVKQLQTLSAAVFREHPRVVHKTFFRGLVRCEGVAALAYIEKELNSLLTLLVSTKPTGLELDDSKIALEWCNVILNKVVTLKAPIPDLLGIQQASGLQMASLRMEASAKSLRTLTMFNTAPVHSSDHRDEAYDSTGRSPDSMGRSWDSGGYGLPLSSKINQV